jgi:hypothetical protein
MSRAKEKVRAKSSRKTPKRKRGVPVLGMSVDQFCASHSIGRDLFYALMRVGKGPQCMQLGRRRIITTEAAQRWQAQREAETGAA